MMSDYPPPGQSPYYTDNPTQPIYPQQLPPLHPPPQYAYTPAPFPQGQAPYAYQPAPHTYGGTPQEGYAPVANYQQPYAQQQQQQQQPQSQKEGCCQTVVQYLTCICAGLLCYMCLCSMCDENMAGGGGMCGDCMENGDGMSFDD